MLCTAGLSLRFSSPGTKKLGVHWNGILPVPDLVGRSRHRVLKKVAFVKKCKNVYRCNREQRHGDRH